MRSREQERAGAMIKKVNEVARAAYVSAECADGFRQGTDLNIHAPMHAKMIDRAASGFAEHTGRMSVVDHHDRAVLFGHIAPAWQRADVAIHRTDRIGNQP